ncbi:MAG: hypothetical protein COU69_04075 [Candidatus Pacebacteria bacterium CG10_big_fil_rev_8_21_14_0_10_56_10]|nr:MAG: hypothetical protein COU69_04075 [Candidatus Pacebacteria bacterium CG10_big_fil_rev_8_21_14_0_10_56_10]
MLNRQTHEYHLKRILRDILNDPALGSQLALKGGTCLYLFYDLPRFSVDLDFNMVSERDLDVKSMNTVLAKHLDVENGRYKEGESGWLWEASYEKGQRQFQVDVNRQQYPDQYVLKQFYGLSVLTMVPDYVFAHKLCAITDRPKLQNRDLFDSWFMFNDHRFEINQEIVFIRTGKTVAEYLAELAVFIKKSLKKTSVLHGLGELLDEKQKTWVKEKLVSELLAHIEMKVDTLDT